MILEPCSSSGTEQHGRSLQWDIKMSGSWMVGFLSGSKRAYQLSHVIESSKMKTLAINSKPIESAICNKLKLLRNLLKIL